MKMKVIKFKSDNGYGYYSYSYLTDHWRLFRKNLVSRLCTEGVKAYVGDVDYVCFAKKPPAYARSQAYKIKLHKTSHVYPKYYFYFLDTWRPTRIELTAHTYNFFYDRGLEKQTFYAWGEYK